MDFYSAKWRACCEHEVKSHIAIDSINTEAYSCDLFAATFPKHLESFSGNEFINVESGNVESKGILYQLFAVPIPEPGVPSAANSAHFFTASS
jgi:hypothetical protein